MIGSVFLQQAWLGVSGLRARQGVPDLFAHGGTDVGQKRRPAGFPDGAVTEPFGGVSEVQAPLGPSHADEQQPSLLTYLLVVGAVRRHSRPAQRKQPILTADRKSVV